MCIVINIICIKINSNKKGNLIQEKMSNENTFALYKKGVRKNI